MASDIVKPEVRAYLLGALDEPHADRLEARYIGDAVLLDEVRAEEEALVDDYLADRLTAVDRARFESSYLASPVHRDRVAMARTLADRLAAAAPGPVAGPAFYGWMAMAAAVVLASLWLVARPASETRRVQGSPSQPAPLPPALVAPAPAPTPTPAPSSPTQPRLREVFAITISPIAARGGAEPQLYRPPAGLELSVRLEGSPEPGDRTYTAELQTPEGQVVWRGRFRPAAAGTGLLTWIILPAGLPPNDYVIVIAANRAERGRYVLRIRASSPAGRAPQR
jgi:hypothetical protein